MTSMSASVDLADRVGSRVFLRIRAATLLFPTLWLLVWGISLSRSLFDPIGFDQAFWQFITERVMLGDRMYVDLFDQNAPGIIGIHWLSTHLAGRSPMALRIFDAGWQLLTMMAFVLLSYRDGRRWSVGWLAAILYALAYYGTGYVHTAQRDGFTVLPMLIALHIVATEPSAIKRFWRSIWLYVVAGVLGFAIFSIKPPLGVCFGVLWLQCLADGWTRRRVGVARWTPLAGMTIGFLGSATAGVALLMQLGWWEGFVKTMGRSETTEYVLGPTLVRGLMPATFLAVVVIAIVLIGMFMYYRGIAVRRGETRPSPLSELLRAGMVAVAVCAGLLTIFSWPEWHKAAISHIGLLLPACGSVLICTWQGRSRIWRLILLLGVAVFGAIVLHGHFWMYHFYPFLACVSYLSAAELVQRLGPIAKGKLTSSQSKKGLVWGGICLGAVVSLAIGKWGHKMTFYYKHAHVLAGTTLMGNYDQITKHKPRYPLYSTTHRTAERVRELTAETDPIACLINEPRLYYLAQRPAAHRLIMTNELYEPLFAEFVQAICELRPKVVLARVPAAVRGSQDMAAIQKAVFDATESFFGPAAKGMRDVYHVTEVIDDVCILQPVASHHKAMRLLRWAQSACSTREFKVASAGLNRPPCIHKPLRCFATRPVNKPG